MGDLAAKQERARRLRTAVEEWRAAQNRLRAPMVMVYRSQVEQVLSHPALNNGTKLVAIALLTRTSRNGEVRVKVEELATSVGLTKRYVQMALSTLQEVGVLREVHYSPNNLTNFFLIPPGEAPAVPIGER